MVFQDLVDSPQKVKTLAGSVAFLVIFPIYFAVLPSLIDEDISAGSSPGLSGSINVIFEESEITLSESVTLGDGESHDTFFDLILDYERILGYVCLLYTSPSPRDLSTSRMPSSA